ncbi:MULTISPECIES: ABC transporter ATP-binding protein [unclassified Caballeronia]|uniref:ABC transporter ATP-binding protein n=1 Tax=unclassified Caballeronia TaxID=2646786 RepID=UPI002866753C|nr:MULTISPECIES: ABC transporter ATP-binding protein [unclassified Caballeronia]MDR5823644.1 ABC transporter ATP-binding protein [Caballeronia sp. LZ043]MDR5881554.1 ABC transporter ATP-binding protein [Caballeronia sp. LZ032]
MLDVSNLSVRYGAIEALKGVTLNVTPGEIVTIIGANGAGKSTLLRALSGLIRPAAGRIRFEGADLSAVPAHTIVRNGLVHVPEGRMALAKLSVLENLLAATGIRRDKSEVAADVDRVMGRFPILRERAKQLAGTLSGGQQQMLVMARALLARPRLLLLDEPSLGLAPVISQQIFELVSEIRREGVTVLLIEQNAKRALAIADRAYVLELGRIALTGAAAAVASDPRVIQAYLGG